MRYLPVFINNYFFISLLFATIFQFALIRKVYIPRFCYHKLLNIAGNCRMCLLELKQSLKLVVSCATLLAVGSSFYTKTRVVKKAREGVLEQLLINHPLDCPICDQGGECDLQDQVMVFGGDRSRFYEEKKKTAEDKEFGFTIKMFLNRCIYCGRCVRFLNNLLFDFNLKMLGRGLNMEISLYELWSNKVNFLLTNITDLCPVGALLVKPYSFLARPWEIINNVGISIVNSLCPNIKISYQGTLILRILPKSNNFLNEEWIDENSRFFFDSLLAQRLLCPLFFLKNFYIMTWLDYLKVLKFYIYFYFNIFFKLSNKFLYFNLLFDKFLSFNFINLLKKFIAKLGAKPFKTYQNLDFRKDFLSTIQSYYWKNLDFVLIINSNLKFENPILFLKLNVLYKVKNFFYYILGFNSNYINFFHFYLGNSSKNFLKFFENNLISLKYLNILCFIIGNVFFDKLFYFKQYLEQKNINFYYIYAYITLISFAELNLKNRLIFFNFTNFILSLNFNMNDFILNSSISKNYFKSYYSSHGLYNSFKNYFILPIKIFIEENNFYLNIESWLQFSSISLYKYNFEKFKSLDKFFYSINEFFYFNKLVITTFFYFNYLKGIKTSFEAVLKQNLNFNFKKKNFYFLKVKVLGFSSYLDVLYSSAFTKLSLILERINRQISNIDFCFIKKIIISGI